MYYQDEAEKKERRRLITFAIATVVLILILIIAIVVVATKKVGSKDTSKDVNTSVVAVDENSSSEETASGDIGTLSTETIEADKTAESTKTTDAPVINVVASPDIPTTGPEDLLPVALVLGALTAFSASAVMAKREQLK